MHLEKIFNDNVTHTINCLDLVLIMYYDSQSVLAQFVYE